MGKSQMRRLIEARTLTRRLYNIKRYTIIDEETERRIPMVHIEKKN